MRNAAPMILGLGCAPFCAPVIGFFHGAFQPHLDQMQHTPVNDPARQRFQQIGMGNGPEVVRQVGIDHVRTAAEHQLLHLDHRLLGVALRAIGVLFGWKIGFEDRLQHQHRCCHARPDRARLRCQAAEVCRWPWGYKRV